MKPKVEYDAAANAAYIRLSTEAVQELGLEVGSIATAVIKATNVTIESRS